MEAPESFWAHEKAERAHIKPASCFQPIYSREKDCPLNNRIFLSGRLHKYLDGRSLIPTSAPQVNIRFVRSEPNSFKIDSNQRCRVSVWIEWYFFSETETMVPWKVESFTNKEKNDKRDAALGDGFRKVQIICRLQGK